MRFSDFISPVPVDEFLADYYRQQPLHIPAPEACSKAVMPWARMNELLAVRSHWSEANLKLILNSRPIFPELYLDDVETSAGKLRRAAPAKVEVFLSMGASLVANSVEEIAPEIHEIASALSKRLGGRAGANIYCSFKGVQAFASHCDLHEVFAIQCEGEKMWNIYQNRAASPIENLETPDAQAMIDAAKGPVALQVKMRPGDVLYIPRGYYHDAIAMEGASLHVTFSVIPLTGRILFGMLEEAAIQDEKFREYLPDAQSSGGAALEAHLTSLAKQLASIMQSQGFKDEVIARQRELWQPEHEFHLPERQQLVFFARTNQAAEVRRGRDGAVLLTQGASIRLSALASAAEWLLARPAFSIQELSARYPQIDSKELKALVEQLERCGLVHPYSPEL